MTRVTDQHSYLLSDSPESMEPRLIFDPKKGKMRVACFASGSGTNADKIIQYSKDANYQVVLLFTDVRDSRVKKNGDKMSKVKDLAKKHGISYEYEDIRDFYKSKGHKNRRDISIRPEFDERVIKKIEQYNIDLICNAGYMSIMTPPILERYNGQIINVHPADLSLKDGDERKYVGIHVVDEAILAGEKEVRSTTHIVREKVDQGEILVISGSVKIVLPEDVSIQDLQEDKKLLKSVVSEHQDKLKMNGDWVIYPLTVQMISEGRFGLDGKGGVWLDGEPAPFGYRMD